MIWLCILIFVVIYFLECVLKLKTPQQKKEKKNNKKQVFFHFSYYLDI